MDKGEEKRRETGKRKIERDRGLGTVRCS